ncbi:osteoclast-stimulating factor, putative [Entamoeba invadens IP1]|uniref:osteoclast-stimulating factor, putative n=1 Tax=Entamoeba invadens IP1 TaxID=370355 RepID=UPI0002C3D242|nr:osteoclast-stimulating factor, putative [Entamoeba invadens IP1]ELP93264.1 osteoclast-stimulating factor, putative [Entamoeba invadens IP1]|eukprot:XP_004260035.1 osteoclast-stimulating factor, putative [Entamoeba invadens IP1]
MSQPPVPAKRAAKKEKDPKATFTKPSRLIAAAKAGEDELIKEYMDDKTKSIDINKVDSLGQSSMHWAAHSGYPNTIQTLYNYGGNVNVQDKEGETPLHKAAWKDKLQTISKLISLGADVTIKNNKGQTPFDVAKSMEAKKLLYIPSDNLEEDLEDSRDEDDD